MHCEKVERRSRVSEVAVGDAVLPPSGLSKPLLSSTSPTSLASNRLAAMGAISNAPDGPAGFGAVNKPTTSKQPALSQCINDLWPFVSDLAWDQGGQIVHGRRRHEGDVSEPELIRAHGGEIATTRSGAGCASLSRRVVVTLFQRRLAPVNPAPRIRRAIRLRPCLLPVARSSARFLGDPHVSREVA